MVVDTTWKAHPRDSDDEAAWNGHAGRIGLLIGSAGLSGSWSTAILSSFIHEQSKSFRPELIALVSILVSVASLVFLVLRRNQAGDRRGRRLLAWITVATAFAARTSAVDSSRWMVESASAPYATGSSIIEVEAVVRSIDRGRDSGGVADPVRGDEWCPVRAIVEVTGGDVDAWVGLRLSVRFDRAGGQEVVGARVVLRGRWLKRSIRTTGVAGRSLPAAGWAPGVLVVSHPGLVEITDPPSNVVGGIVDEARNRWAMAVARIDERLSVLGGGTDTGILSAMLSGERRILGDRFRNSAIRSGTSHLLAISGLHLAVIALIAGVAARTLLPRPSRLADSIVVSSILLFGIVVIPTPSVQRAVLMAVGCGGLRIMGRRVGSRPVVLLCLSAMCWWEPGLMGSVGFQLTSVATIALAFSMSKARRRWFGPPDRMGVHRRSLVLDPLASGVAAGIVAWSSTIPVVLGAFGVFSPLSVPATILVTPLLFPILGFGAIFGVIEMVFPGGMTDPMARFLVVPTDLFAGLTAGMADLSPIISTTHGGPGTLLSVPLAVAIALLPGCQCRRLRWGGFAMVLVATGWTFGFRNTEVSPRVRMIDVGDGSAIVVRCDRGALLFDAGSTSDGRSGFRGIIPALRNSGVRRLDAIVISHANSDHFNAVPGILASMPVGTIFTTHDFLERARSGRRPDLEVILQEAHDSGVDVVPLERGDRFEMERLRFRVIHPKRTDTHRTINDSSMVLAVDVPGVESSRTVDLLLCGDIETEGMSRILDREPSITAMVMELPHHGSWRPITVEMIRTLDPDVIIQSTGSRRWRHDRFGRACAGRRRLVTARDGSFVVDLSSE